MNHNHETHPHNILFDGPIQNHPINLGNGNRLENIEGIYGSRKAKMCLQAYMVFLFLQYITAFSSVPFEDVENRPIMCIFASAYTLFMVCLTLLSFAIYLQHIINNSQFAVCACLLPISASTIPNTISFNSILFSAVCQYIGLILSVITVPLCFNSKQMYSYEYTDIENPMIPVKVDVTYYITCLSILSVIVNSLACFTCTTNGFIFGKALYNLSNHIDRRNRGQLNLEVIEGLPKIEVDEVRAKAFLV